jgi:hypothetical protein
MLLITLLANTILAAVLSSSELQKCNRRGGISGYEDECKEKLVLLLSVDSSTMLADSHINAQVRTARDTDGLDQQLY